MALAISGVLLLLGVGQRTFLAGPSEIVYSISDEQNAPYAVLDVSELAKLDGQANVVMRGDTAFTALANTRDAAAWLEPFDHVQLTIDPATKSIVSSPVRGKAPTIDMLEVDDDGNAIPIDPRGSDLWLDERSGDEGVSRMAVEAVGEQSIIIAGTGESPIPKGAALVWVQDRATPWAGPLLAAGGLFAALGAVLYLIAFDRDKRALGPRRGRSGPLLGVRNVFGGSKKRSTGSAESEGALKRGSHDNAPELAGTAAAGAMGAATAGAGAPEGTDTPADSEAVAAAELVRESSPEQEQDQEGEPFDVGLDDAAVDAVDAVVVEEEADAADTDAVADVEPVEGDAGESDTADDAADAPEDEAATKGDDHAK